MQDVAACQARNLTLLQGVADSMAPFSLDYTPSLLDQYMQLFCSSIRLQLLACALPSKLLWQLYSLVYSYTRIKAGSSQDQEVPDKEALTQVVSSFDAAIPKLQADFQGLCPRIGQVSSVSAYIPYTRRPGMPTFRKTGHVLELPCPQLHLNVSPSKCQHNRQCFFRAETEQRVI